ncbi:MAG TPA: hypothetical protein VE870_11235 [Bacteroidales bacterium]|nr:hypothetical protein [Bacteroidales bacterium]
MLSRLGILILVFLILDLIFGHYINRLGVNSFRIKHDYLHHALLPSQNSTARWGRRVYHVNTNSLGCRDKDCRDVDVSRKGPRLLILGDSHVEGVGIAYPNTMAGIVQDSLSREGIDVINGSVVSYSPKLYYLKARYLLNNKNIHVTDLLVMIDISDLQNEIVYENFKPDSSSRAGISYRIRKFLMMNSFIYRHIHIVVKKIKIKSFIKHSEYFRNYAMKHSEKDILELYSSFFNNYEDDQLVADPEFHAVQDWFYIDRYKPLAEKGLQLEMKNISRLKTLCDEKGIRLSLSVHPWRKQVMLRDTSDYYVGQWRKFCGENEINFINLYPAFIDPPVSAVFAKDLFLPQDNHWNEFGNAIVARKILDKLKMPGPR